MEEPAQRPETVLQYHHHHIGVLDQCSAIVLLGGAKIVRTTVDPDVNRQFFGLVTGAIRPIDIGDQAIFAANHGSGALPASGGFSLHTLGMALRCIPCTGPVFGWLWCAPAQVAHWGFGVGQTMPDQCVFFNYTLDYAVGEGYPGTGRFGNSTAATAAATQATG